MGNGEWEWKMENEKWGTGNGEWEMGNITWEIVFFLIFTLTFYNVE